MSLAAETLPCASCHAPVDPLRAPRVAHFHERFCYFCSVSCEQTYRVGEPERSQARLRHTPTAAAAPLPSFEDPSWAEPLPSLDEAEALSEPSGGSEEAAGTSQPEPGEADSDAAHLPFDPALSVDAGTLLLSLSVLGAALSLVLALTGSSELSLAARLVVAAVATAALVAECAMGHRSVTELNPLATLSGPVVATAAAIGLRLSEQVEAESAIVLAGIVTLCAATGLLMVRRARRPLELERLQLLAALDQPGRRIVAGEVQSTSAADLRPGEEIVVEPGDILPVDATVTAGTALVLPWFGAKAQVERKEGDSLVAGATVLEGTLRAIVGWAGHDRAFVRLAHDPRRRADVHGKLARLGRHLAERAAPFVAGFAALLAFAGSGSSPSVMLLGVASYAAFAQAGLAEIGSLQLMRAVLASLRRGIAFRSAEALERAGRVSSVAFCARGTLLLGEPEVTSIDALSGHDAESVLSFAAGAEASVEHPAAAAVLRAARARSVRPDAVRSPTPVPGLGITAVAGSGQTLAVGSRALMLRERIGVAGAEARISELEAMGRSVLLVALGNRLIGVIGLQDGLRAGARAAVQHVLDVHVEPILLSGDARDTCEALGRALDIDHLRPEVPPGERGDEVRRLRDGGAVVAVVGRTPIDDSALSAADVSVALSVAGSSSAEWSVQLASDDVRDAAYSLRVAHRAHREAQLGYVLILAPALCGVVVAAFGFAPAALAPILTCLGSAVALSRLRNER
ncbi:MAG: cation-translocating P-type ATPase [Myxococcales bacterium]|nr:MAG: cation-translocating P-type ATPase [Myxococcales bacterium]